MIEKKLNTHYNKLIASQLLYALLSDRRISERFLFHPKLIWGQQNKKSIHRRRASNNNDDNSIPAEDTERLLCGEEIDRRRY